MKTILFNNLYLNDYYLLISKDEKKHMKKYHEIITDYYFGEKTFEQSEIKMQINTIQKLINKNNLSDRDIDLLISSDLNSQITASSYAAPYFNIPFLGIYAACSSFTEELLLAGIFNKTNDAKRIVTSISSHALTAERQFRYPIEYGFPRKKTQTYTATAAIASLLSKNTGKLKIESATIGKVIEMGIKDVNNMGAIMAPAAASTLYEHLRDLKRDVSYYDLILTGDLGCVGKEIFKEYALQEYGIKFNKYLDAGCELYLDSQDVYAGGSGPTCLPLILFNKILLSKKYKKILILGTGSLHSTTLVNQHIPVPAIAHAVSLEVL
jgi:stage V sporulation protein AD